MDTRDFRIRDEGNLLLVTKASNKKCEQKKKKKKLLRAIWRGEAVRCHRGGDVIINSFQSALHHCPDLLVVGPPLPFVFC